MLAVVLPPRTFWATSRRRSWFTVAVFGHLVVLLLAKVGGNPKNEVAFVQRKGGDRCSSVNLKI